MAQFLAHPRLWDIVVPDSAGFEIVRSHHVGADIVFTCDYRHPHFDANFGANCLSSMVASQSDSLPTENTKGEIFFRCDEQG